MVKSAEVPQGIIYTDKRNYENFKDYYYAEHFTIKLKSERQN